MKKVLPALCGAFLAMLVMWLVLGAAAPLPILRNQWTTNFPGQQIKGTTTFDSTMTVGQVLISADLVNPGIGFNAGYVGDLGWDTGGKTLVSGNTTINGQFTQTGTLGASFAGSVSNAGVSSFGGTAIAYNSTATTNVPFTIRGIPGTTTNLAEIFGTGGKIASIGTNTWLHIGNLALALAPIHIGEGNVNASTDSQVLISRTVDDTSGTGNGHAFSDSCTITRSGVIGYNSYDATPTFGGGLIYDHYAGFQSRAKVSLTGSGWISNYYGVFVSMNSQSGGITHAKRVYLNDPPATGWITNNYGVFVDEMTNGILANYSIYTVGTAPARFGSNVTALGSIRATNGFASYLSNSLAPFAFTFPATTVKWTNPVPFNIEVYVDNTGVTGTSFQKNGSQIFSSVVGDVTVGLQPAEYISATYTVGTPQGKWSPR